MPPAPRFVYRYRIGIEQAALTIPLSKMGTQEAPATPSAFYKMLAVPDAQELILRETELLPCQRVPFQSALDHTLAEDLTAVEAVPGFRASIKVRLC